MYSCAINANLTEVATPRAVLPLSLSEVKLYLKTDTVSTTEDSLLTSMINAAADYCEQYTGRILINTTFKSYYDDLDFLKIPRACVSSVTSLKYYDTSNILQTISSSEYFLRKENNYSYIQSASDYGFTESVHLTRPNVVELTYISGYGAASSNIPDLLKQGLYEYVAYLYYNRGDCIDYMADLPIPSIVKRNYDLYKIRKI